MAIMNTHTEPSFAIVVAEIPIDKIKTVTYDDVIALGFEIGTPIP